MQIRLYKMICNRATLGQWALKLRWPVLAGALMLLTNLGMAQILTNGGFESSLTGWSSSLSSGGSATFANSGSNMHKGSSCLLVTVSNAGTASNSVRMVSSSFAASSTNTYVLRFWANANVLDANLGVNILGATPVYPQIPFQLSTNSMAAGDQHYQEYLYAFKASGTVSIAFNFQTVAQYWLDDVEVLDVNHTEGFDVPMTYLWQWGEFNFIATNSAKIGWTGGDNDKSRLLPDGSVAWIFNDSMATTLSANSFYSNIRGNSSLPRNCVVHQIGTNLIWLNNGANTFFTPANSTPLNQNAEQIKLAANGLYWISGSAVENNKLYVLLMGVDGGAYTNLCTSVATLSLPNLQLTGMITNLTAPGTLSFGDLLKGDDGYYYVYSDSTQGGAKVARVPVGQLAVDSAWRFWNGTTWVTDHNQGATLANFQGSSATRLGTSNYCAVYSPVLGLSIYAQFALTPMGPWGGDMLIYSVWDQGGEGIFSDYMPNICGGTGSNGVYTIGYSDNGTPESWFTKTPADKSWYNPHFIVAPLWQWSPFTGNYAANANFGFETPSIGSGSSAYQYNPTGGSWTFSGSSPNGSGIVGNGSAFGNPTAPQGVQAAFLQEYGTISQTISGLIPGVNYTIGFLGAERPFNNSAQSWNVTVNGTVVASFNPGSSATSYMPCTATFKATAATQTVAFVGTDLAGGDNTVFIDNVRITAPPIVPQVNLNIQLSGGNLVLSWPLGLLLQATNIVGPWTTNNATSPYTNQPNNPQMFYRLQVQ